MGVPTMKILRWMIVSSLLLSVPCAAAAQGIRSLAVPPFENLTGDARLDWIGHGFSRTLVDKLNAIAEFTAVPVKARGFYTTDGNVDLASVTTAAGGLAADLLLVGAVIKGADIDRLDDPLEITVRLVDIASTRQIGTVDLKGTVRQLFSMETDLAAWVAGLFDIRLSPGEAEALRDQPTRSLQAYKETVLGTIFLEDGKYDAAVQMFEEAMRHHPGIFYARAHNLMAQAYILSGKKEEMLKKFKKDSAEISQVYYDLAMAQEFTGDVEKARENYGLFIKYTDRKTLLWRKREPGGEIVETRGERLVLKDGKGRLSVLSAATGHPATPAGERDAVAPAAEAPAKTADLVPQEERQHLTTRVAVSGDRCYYGLDNGHLVGRSLSDGRRTWAYRTRGKPAGRLVIDGGRLFAADDRGEIYALGLNEGGAPTDVSAYLKMAALAVMLNRSADAAELYRYIVDEVKFNVPEAWHALWELAKAGDDPSAADRYWRNYQEAQF